MKRIKKELREKMQAELPESLKKENIVANLQKGESSGMDFIESPKKSFNFKIWVPLVASLVLVCIVCAAFYNAPKPQISTQSESITNAESENYDELLNTLKKIKKDGYYKLYMSDGIEGGNINGGMGSEKPGDYDSQSENHSFATTNIQEKGVDESNTILTDGKYIYAVNAGKITFNIIKNENGKMEMLSTVPIKGTEDDMLSNVSMYLYKNYVAVIYNKYLPSDENAQELSYDLINTCVKIFDVKDKKSPKLLMSYAQEGAEIGTRRIDNKIYIISQRKINFETLEKDDSWIPKIYNNDIESQIKPSKISIYENLKSPNYTIIGVVNMLAKDDVKVTAVLDDCNYIYSSKNNIYTVALPYSGLDKNETKIHKYEITEDGVKDAAVCKVLGVPYNQFAFSENDGYLRVATTVLTNSQQSSGVGLMVPQGDSNNVYVLDENLKELSSLTGLARGETIKSVRFMGSMMYLVTFRQTDPIFVIDLSDPKEPTLKGEVKLPGFSYYLHPISETLLIGIGKDGTENGVNENVKVSLFDVSNPLSPKEISKSLVLESNNTEYSAFTMLYCEHKLFISLPNNEFVIPVEILGNCKAEQHYIRYGVKDNKIYEIARYFNDEYAQAMGGTFIDNVFYSMGLDKESLDQIVSAYDLKTNKPISKIKF